MSRHALWNNSTGPHLRGAVITQRRVYPEIDGPEFLGPGPLGVPVSDTALANLSAAGANLLVLSHPGVFTEEAPFRIDQDALDNLDDLVTRADRWGLFVVIGFRTGPGRSAFTFHRDDAGSWFPEHMLNDRVWTDERYHLAWEEMWRTTADYFRGRNNLAGFLLMVEPNANQVAPASDGRPLEIWDPQELANRVANTPADWPSLARRLARIVRQTNPDVPVLVSPDGYANKLFEANLGLAADDPSVLCVHDYAPRAFSHQSRTDSLAVMPGDGRFAPPRHPRWMMGEFGAHRWAPGVSGYLDERIRDLEQAGAGWSVFRWDSGWRVYENRENAFNPLYGARADAAAPVQSSELVRRLQGFWERNNERPQRNLRR